MAQTVLAAAASPWAVLMGMAPVLQIRRMLREQSSREVSVGYFTILLIGFLLVARLEKVALRLAADAPNMLSSGNELIAHYLSPDRRPIEKQWSRKHAETQRYLCERFLRPVMGHLACQDIKAAHMQAAVNAAPTAAEGRRVRATISALTAAGIAGGYLASPRLKEVHWQANGRQTVSLRAILAGESPLFVDPGEIPAGEDVARLGQAIATLRRGLYELMVHFAAYTGLRCRDSSKSWDVFSLAGRPVAGAGGGDPGRCGVFPP